jgi:ABC-2 type transport system permease protein
VIRIISGLTFRALAGRRRVLLVSLLCALPILVALLARASGRLTGVDTVTNTVMDRLVISTLVPLVALVFGTSALGSELDDGTAIYLLAKPIPRWKIVAAKVFVAAGLAVLVTTPAAFLAAVILGGGGMAGAVGYAVGTAVAASLYAVVFLALSLVTGRALALGLIYVLVWEGLFAGLLPGTRTFSIRQYALGIADAFSGGHRATAGVALDGRSAVLLAVAVSAVALAVAIRRLQTYEVGEAD